jgi:hypothetical protein
LAGETITKQIKNGAANAIGNRPVCNSFTKVFFWPHLSIELDVCEKDVVRAIIITGNGYVSALDCRHRKLQPDLNPGLKKKFPMNYSTYYSRPEN